MCTPRRHHYIPQFLLAYFTFKGGKRDRLWVFDQAQCRQWAAIPENTAHKRDFHKVDAAANGDPMAVENGLADFENDVAIVIRNIVASRALPNVPRDHELLIKFVALLINRVPAVRHAISSFGLEVRAKEEFARQWLRESGKGVPQEVSEESDQIFDQTWLVENIIRGVEVLVPFLVERKWSLWFVDDDAPDLICSDNPVALTSTINAAGPRPAGYGDSHTQVSCPLTRRILLLGSFEGQPDAAPLDRRAVATANSCTGRNANQLYSGADDFVWLMKDGRIGTKADLLQTLQG